MDFLDGSFGMDFRQGFGLRPLAWTFGTNLLGPEEEGIGDSGQHAYQSQNL